MPAVGLMLILIGMWLVVRVLTGGLSHTLEHL